MLVLILLLEDNIIHQFQIIQLIPINAKKNGDNEVFLPYDEERYTLIRSNGDTEILSDDRISLTNGSTTLTINGLGANDTNSRLITTLRKSNIKSKVKIKNISKDIIINKSRDTASGIGSTTLGDGLESGNYPYGTREFGTK